MTFVFFVIISIVIPLLVISLYISPMDNIKNITCPKCNHQFDVEEVLAGKLEAQYKAKYQSQFSALVAEFEAKEKAFEEKRRKANELVMDRVRKELDAKEKALKNKMQEEYAVQIKSQQEELEEKRLQLNKLQENEIKLIKLQRQMEEQEKEIEIRLQRQMTEEMQRKEEVIKKRIAEEISNKQRERDHQKELELREKDKQLEDQKRLIDEMKRKAEQGSMQMQGEILEIAIEELLSREFPGDQVDEVPKGVRGADSLLQVYDEHRQHCGTIILESKRTKAFANDWIAKLKKDQRSISADIAILVTEVMPKGYSSFTEIQGIWVCSFQELVGLIYVLRQILIKTKSVQAAQINKGDKMELLYHFLTGDEFKHQISAIVEGFSAMKQDLDKEKRAMASIWKKREKQINLVVENTIDMYSSIKGIAGKAIPTIQQLELGEGSDVLDLE